MSRKKNSSDDKKLSPWGKRWSLFIDSSGLNQRGLANRLNISTGYLNDLRKGASKGMGYKSMTGIQREFPEWEDYLAFRTDIPPGGAPYVQPPERMLPPPQGEQHRDSDRGSYGAPDLAGFGVVLKVDPGEAVYIRKVREVLASGETATAEALKANIDQFHEKVRERRSGRQLTERVEALEKEVRGLKNGDASAAGDPVAEMECSE